MAADLEEAPFVIFATFEGGWDQLLALDPRDHKDFGVSAGAGAIQTGYDIIANADATTAAILADGDGSGRVQPEGSNIEFGPCIGELSDLFLDLCVVRGVNMGTLTHEVGRRYLNTGKFPSGLQANGSSMPTSVAAQYEGLDLVIPNLVVGMETFNDGLPSFATGLRINNTNDLRAVLVSMEDIAEDFGKPYPLVLKDASAAAVEDHLWTDKCIERLLDADGQVTTFLDSRVGAEALSSGEYFQSFNFVGEPSDPQMQALYEHFGVGNPGLSQQLSGPLGSAMVAAQAITQGISQCVSLALAEGIDHHDDAWETDHAPALRSGFDALARLITYLKATPYKDGSYWDHTVLLCGSEFARTPDINGRGGRDHHLASSCLVAGRGIRGNTVIGGTDDTKMGVQAVNPATGEVDELDGVYVRPADIHATLLQAAGVSWDHLSNQDPVILDRMLK